MSRSLCLPINATSMLKKAILKIIDTKLDKIKMIFMFQICNSEKSINGQ